MPFSLFWKRVFKFPVFPEKEKGAVFSATQKLELSSCLSWKLSVITATHFFASDVTLA